MATSSREDFYKDDGRRRRRAGQEQCNYNSVCYSCLLECFFKCLSKNTRTNAFRLNTISNIAHIYPMFDLGIFIRADSDWLLGRLKVILIENAYHGYRSATSNGEEQSSSKQESMTVGSIGGEIGGRTLSD